MNNIKIMDEKLANMIAAGEVVERPSSIIKELVENSLDANATNIIVSVLNNGLSLIQVTDNGFGISKDNLKLAFFRHATSKLTTELDLERINTLGFRGEAIPAIASVSKVTIASKTKDSEGNFVTYENNVLIKEGLISLNVGTVVKVENLFYNTPARLKYLKSEYTEKAHIIDTFEKLALSNPSVRFSLYIENELVKETFGNNDIYSLISQIYGSSVIRDMQILDETFSNINIKAYLASPKIARNKRSDIVIFTNGRYVRNYGITNAVIDGYHTFLMKNKYPLVLLFITLDPYLIDVNVHPQKLEVKFSNESLLKYQIESLIRKKLSSEKLEISRPFLSSIKDELNSNINNNDNSLFYDENITNPPKPTYLKEELNFLFNEEKNDVIKNNLDKLPELYYIGTLASTYLLFQNNNGLYLVDQHAAEERVNYEYYSNLHSNLEIIKNEMFIPLELEITNNDKNFIKEHILKFNDLGFYFDDFINLLSYPNFLKEKDLLAAINNMIVLIAEKNIVKTEWLLDELAKSRSCKASIKASDKINRKEIDNLIDRLRNAKNPYTCPHGRPTIINITYYEIEKMFKRIV